MVQELAHYAPICILEHSSYPFLFHIFRAPDSAPIKAKMMYTSTKDSIKKKLVGIQVEVQATDAAEISEDAVAERAKKDVK